MSESAGTEPAVDRAELASSGLLSFYDRLRPRIERSISRSTTPAVAEALLVAPDVFILLARLALDPQVPAASRRLIAGAVAYFVLPVDLLPEAVLGGVGFLDDLVLGCLVLAEAFGEDLEPWAERHWSGPNKLRGTLSDVGRAAGALLGENLYARLRRLLERRGVRLDEE